MYGRWDGSDSAAQQVVESALYEMAEGLGLEHFMFIYQEHEAHKPMRLGVIDGSRGVFAREYIARRWFSIDPLFARAQRLATPFWGWNSVAIETRGQLELHEMAADQGFATVAVIPALSPWDGVTGALYLGSSATREPARNFSQRHPQLRAMAIDVMTWSVRNAYRRDLGGDFRLKKLERAVLRCELLDYTMADTAQMLDLPVTKVAFLFRSAKERTRAPNKREAARRCLMAGVLTI